MNTQQRIQQLIAEHPVVLFMKGTPQFPMCGFSGRAVQLLKMCGVDVLKDEAIRQGVKAFANWPTIPQLYVDAAFIGGVDIMAEMAQSGELQQLFSDLFKNIN